MQAHCNRNEWCDVVKKRRCRIDTGIILKESKTEIATEIFNNKFMFNSTRLYDESDIIQYKTQIQKNNNLKIFQIHWY